MNSAKVEEVFAAVRRVCEGGEDVVVLKAARTGWIVDGKVDESREDDIPEDGACGEILIRGAVGGKVYEALTDAHGRRLKVIVCSHAKKSPYLQIPLGIGYIKTERRMEEAGVCEFGIELFETFDARELEAAQKASPGLRNGAFLRREFYKRAALVPYRGGALACLVRCRVGEFTDPLYSARG